MIVGILVMLTLALALVLFFYQSRKKILQEQMRNQQLELEHQQALLFKTIRTQEDERQRVAKELHDEIGSKLNVIALHLHRLQRPATEVTTVAEEAQQLLNTTIESTRRIAYDLLPPTLEKFGLLEATKELCEHYQRTGEMEVVLQVMKNDANNIDYTTSLNLYRILQELLNNTLKYAEAQRVTIQLWLEESGIRIEYRDDGKGFNANDPQRARGLGLKNMQSRVDMIGGKYELKTAEGEGVEVKIEVSF
ncbi:MAG: sensor histidine kinase [Saprospiraceae bacterium]